MGRRGVTEIARYGKWIVLENSTTQYFYVKPPVGRRIRFLSEEAAKAYAKLCEEILT
jgi:hypothetical protein